ncbi:MAG: hypothetical protein VX498_07400, partial [Myxococcota bacterium]|nr:hypothetical protein [Myxococcota bacterium]
PVIGTLYFETWVPEDCPEWPGISQWHSVLVNELEGLHLVPMQLVPEDWLPTYPGAAEDLGGADSLPSFVEHWLATQAPEPDGVSGFLILAEVPSLLPEEPQVAPLSFFGHFWQLPDEL